ncbi:MAG: hypothetical protein IKE85_10280 [Mogibacterium sp.]|nr:hypothetical protein [Mogibacterium sp.]
MKESESSDNSKYMINAEGYKYDLRKGVLCCGSIVPFAIHPLADVEALKSQLIRDGNIVPNGNRDYIVAREIGTGPLMAYNLCSNSIESELPDCMICYDPWNEHSDSELIPAQEAWKLWSTYCPNQAFRARIEKDSFRITKVIEAEYDHTFASGKGDGSMSKVEIFVAEALQAAGAVKSYRRGDALQHECDIVDEEGGRQIEFVSIFDEKVPPRYRYHDNFNEEESLLLEYQDFGYNIVAQGVINKFTLKNYTDRYTKELAIYMIGPADEGADKIKAMQDMLFARTGEIRNNYARLHIILHDPLERESFIYCSNDRADEYPDSLCSVNIIRKKTVYVGDMAAKFEDDIQGMESGLEESLHNKYIIIKHCVFDPSIRSMEWIGYTA